MILLQFQAESNVLEKKIKLLEQQLQKRIIPYIYKIACNFSM